jgi:23S rRNA pseudouridine1911/1915/1917 synthase
VHRLDKDTSGLMLVAKSNYAHDRLARALRQRRIARLYEAFVMGAPLPPSGTIDTFFARHPKHRKRYWVPANADGNARRAVTHYKQLETSPCSTVTHIQCRLETGRTHQIRVHMAYKGTPVLGDPVYGPSQQGLSSVLARSQLDADYVAHIQSLTRQALHASQLSFLHPCNKTEMHFESAMPDCIKGLILNKK